ncbi:MAG: hypothetical protein Q9159_003741 [Coniocarpon cinnabarinum]
MAGRLDEHVASAIDKVNASGRPDDEAEDTLFDELENDSELESFREQRMETLQKEWRKQKEFRSSGHGSYVEIKDEKELMDITTSTKYCVTLAPLHNETRFVRINVSNAAFLVTKLKVQVLPCVLAFIDGVGKDRIVGFDGLGTGSDSFGTPDLEARLLHAGVLSRPVLLREPSLKVQSKSSIVQEDSIDEDDWD